MTNSLFPYIIFQQIFLQPKQGQPQNSNVIKLTQDEYPISYQINRAHNLIQSEKEDDKRIG